MLLMILTLQQYGCLMLKFNMFIFNKTLLNYKGKPLCLN